MSYKDDVFSSRLKEMIERLKISQQKLADDTGIDKGLISKYINGKSVPSVNQVSLIVKPYDVNPVWLMGYNVEFYNPTNKSQTLNKINTMLRSLNEQQLEQVLQMLNVMFPKGVE